MNASSLSIQATQLQAECQEELIAIADWWVNYTQDQERGGFYGEVLADNSPAKQANKGVILNARILWFFSEVAEKVGKPEYKIAADRAYLYVMNYFVDKEYGGVYWELDATGKPLNTKKQIYAQAFVIYALCSYYKLTNNSDALKQTLHLFELIEQYAIDHVNAGYLEAFTREWNLIDDVRLSDKDLNYPKSQNTHLHIMEAYTSLYELVSNKVIGAALRYNIEMFDRFMIDRKTRHLRMFMDMQWQDFSPGFTYGHDIEAVWLIGKAVETLGDKQYYDYLFPDLLAIARTNLKEALAEDGHIMDAYDFATGSISDVSVWWVQAEALVGYLYIYSVTKDEKYFFAAENLWRFIKQHQIDLENGEWFWLSNLDDKSLQPDYKVGFWKCPYHNGRAMMEVGRYLQKTPP
jgi:cellobiose epimerase